MDDDKLGGREVPGSNHFTFKIKGKLEERADELIKRIEASRLPELIQTYLDAAEEVRKNKKLSPETKLRKLLPPLHEIQHIFFPNYPKCYTWNHEKKKPVEDDIIPFINDEYIDLKKELDLKNLRPNPEKYSILEDTEFKKLGRLYTSNRNIWLSEEYRWYLTYCRDVNPISEAEFKGKCETKEIDLTETEIIRKPSKWDLIPPERIGPPQVYKSIREIWPDWLPTLSQETIKSKDRLTQILVCYTIKRALNSDEEAIKKLYDLYEKKVEYCALQLAKRHRKLFLYLEKMKTDSKLLLRRLIAGFRPDYILTQLLQDTSEKLIDTIPDWTKKFFIYYLSQWIPQKLTEIQKKAELIRVGETMGLTKDQWKVDFDLGLEIEILLNPNTPIHEGTFWQKSPVRKHEFNKYSYRSKKMGPRQNLTLWLFGSKAHPDFGKLNQFLLNKYLPLAKGEGMIQNIESLVYDDSGEEKFPGSFEEFKEYNVYQKPRKETPDSHFFNPPCKGREEQIKTSISEQEIREKVNLLKKAGIPQRDIKIFTFWKFGKITQGKLAEKHNLSRRQIIRICQKAKTILAPK